VPTIHLLIKGKVQGINYRASARDRALGLRLTGWVRNTREGHVEAMVTGEEVALQQFIDWCRRGPALAVVGDVEVERVADARFEGFEIRRG
jgi:acylphosphatase